MLGKIIIGYTEQDAKVTIASDLLTRCSTEQWAMDLLICECQGWDRKYEKVRKSERITHQFVDVKEVGKKGSRSAKGKQT